MKDNQGFTLFHLLFETFVVFTLKKAIEGEMKKSYTHTQYKRIIYTHTSEK